MTKARHIVVFLFVLLMFTPASRASAVCGDDVNGVRVPCECGDVVISDTRLQPGDPLVSGRCRTDGLMVRARPGASSITLDLAGLSVLGSGHGTGIRVIDGGREGAAIVGGDAGPAEVAGFGTGFRARGQRSVRVLRNVSFTANERDGVVLRGAGTQVQGVAAERNGRDGLRVGGRGARLDGVASQLNGGDGLQFTGDGAQLQDVVSAGNEGLQTRARKRGARAAREQAQ